MYLNLACVDATGVPADQSGKCMVSEAVLEQRLLPLRSAGKQGACGHQAQPPEFMARVFLRCVPCARSCSQPPRQGSERRAAWAGRYLRSLAEVGGERRCPRAVTDTLTLT